MSYLLYFFKNITFLQMTYKKLPIALIPIANEYYSWASDIMKIKSNKNNLNNTNKNWSSYILNTYTPKKYTFKWLKDVIDMYKEFTYPLHQLHSKDFMANPVVWILHKVYWFPVPPQGMYKALYYVKKNSEKYTMTSVSSWWYTYWKIPTVCEVWKIITSIDKNKFYHYPPIELVTYLVDNQNHFYS